MRIIISKILIKLIGRKNLVQAIDVEELNSKIVESKINKCISQVTKLDGTQFYETAIVNNLQKDKSKITIGKNTHIRGELLLFWYAGEINIGNNCYIGKGSSVWSSNSVSIGDNVLIAHNVNIVDTNSHELDYLERCESFKELIVHGRWTNKENIITGPVIIKNNAWISFGATILKGVTIGEGAIIAANSVVTKDVPDFTLVAGNPAKQISNLKDA